MAEVVAIEMARRRVTSFLDYSRCDNVMEHHKEAIDCYNCEAFLQMGIDAYHWLTRADELIRRCVAEGHEEFDENINEALRLQFRKWLIPCRCAHDWVDVQHQRGLDVDNVGEFLKCEAEILAIVTSFDCAPRLSDEMSRLRDEAIEEFEDGKTAEFV
jgi:hypothetical protein